MSKQVNVHVKLIINWQMHVQIIEQTQIFNISRLWPWPWLWLPLSCTQHIFVQLVKMPEKSYKACQSYEMDKNWDGQTDEQCNYYYVLLDRHKKYLPYRFINKQKDVIKIRHKHTTNFKRPSVMSSHINTIQCLD